MANVYQGTLGLIGNTPLVEVTNVEKALGLKAKLLVKLEYFNPAGSVKDRIAKAMIEDAEKKARIDRLHRINQFKLELMPVFDSGIPEKA